ncbi:restriction endonuclease subunit S [uncultured Anaerobiospirillum sp.]|uniref:restriction endonuclease subunit S n=1 Tax=uncultured Anaerobiospirillum sp. TaxID=265728 RepID=UPI002803CE6B|nr:restriction endonuclease subunit S [uncultured Anaerobiospirillum sp.]
MPMREMKSSGVEWIGDIPSSWHITKIKYAYLIISGNGFPISMQGKDTGDFPVFKASDISINHFCTARNSANYITKQESHSFKVLSKGTIIFPKIGEALKKNNRAILGVNACVDNNCQGLVPVNMHDRYSLYLLSCIDMNWFNNACTVPCIDNSKLKNCYIPSPVKQEQTAIAYYLDSKCAEIDALKADIEKQIETLQEYKKSVITEAVTKGLDPNVEMKISGCNWIGQIPKAWTESKVKLHLKRRTVRNPSPGNTEILSLYREYGVIPKNSRDDNHNVTSADTSKYLFVRRGDFVINKMKAWQGSVALSSYEGVVSPAYFVYEFISDQLDKQYLHYLLRSCYKDEFRRLSAGIREGQWDLSPESFSNLLLILPSLEEQIEISQYLETILPQIDKLIRDKGNQLETLAQYKQSLIYEYVTGKKAVPASF